MRSEERRGAAVSAAPQDELVERLLRRIRAEDDLVPPFPAVALRLREARTARGAGLAELTRIVEADPALAATVLRCANSALYLRASAATTLGQAVTRLGAHELARIALTSALAARIHVAGPLAALRRSLWIQAVASAAVAQELSAVRGLGSEDGFLAGLLHDFGKVVACAALERIGDSTPIPVAPYDQWAAILERVHVGVGALVADRWKLPPAVAEVIERHHAEGGKDDRLAVIRVADAVVARLEHAVHVGREELADLPLSPVERSALARVIAALPGHIVSFETEATGDGPSSLITAGASGPSPEQVDASFEVLVNHARRQLAYRATGVCPAAVAAIGDEPVPERRLLEVKLQCPPRPFSCWALVRRCARAAGGFQVELQPYALSGEDRLHWTAAIGAASAG